MFASDRAGLDVRPVNTANTAALHFDWLLNYGPFSQFLFLLLQLAFEVLNLFSFLLVCFPVLVACLFHILKLGFKLFFLDFHGGDQFSASQSFRQLLVETFRDQAAFILLFLEIHNFLKKLLHFFLKRGILLAENGHVCEVAFNFQRHLQPRTLRLVVKLVEVIVVDLPSHTVLRLNSLGKSFEFEVVVHRCDVAFDCLKGAELRFGPNLSDLIVTLALSLPQLVKSSQFLLKPDLCVQLGVQIVRPVLLVGNVV